VDTAFTLDKYFVKQASEVTLADDAKHLDKPSVYATAGTKAEAEMWASTMEAARLAVRDGMDAAFLDANIFKGRRATDRGRLP
jgi:hypothetical protein